MLPAKYHNLLCKEGTVDGAFTDFLVFKGSLGLLLLNRMSCVDCNHAINALSHERCRTHAECANGRQYRGAVCNICQRLWQRARRFPEDPGDARRAFMILDNWIAGFARNSRGRPKGVDYFSDPEERKEFETFRAVFKISRRESSQEGSSSSTLSKRVSVEA